MLRKVAYAQGIFYLLTGIWPLVDIISFMHVTGPKVDIWLVKTVGVLIVVIAIPILMAAIRNKISLEIIILGAGGCVGFILIDTVYVFSDTILPVYLLDAVAELLILIAWLVAVTLKRKKTSTNL